MLKMEPVPTRLHGGESALDRGDPIKDADYYRLTKSEAESCYKLLVSQVKNSQP